MSTRNCIGQDPDIFFPDTPEQASTAKALCSTCPFTLGCAEDALQRGEEYGIWGGVLIERGYVVEVKRRPGRPRKVLVDA